MNNIIKSTLERYDITCNNAERLASLWTARKEKINNLLGLNAENGYRIEIPYSVTPTDTEKIDAIRELKNYILTKGETVTPDELATGKRANGQKLTRWVASLGIGTRTPAQIYKERIESFKREIETFEQAEQRLAKDIIDGARSNWAEYIGQILDNQKTNYQAMIDNYVKATSSAKIIVSTNPADILTASTNCTFDSCYNITHGGYSAGVMLELLSSQSAVSYILDSNGKKDGRAWVYFQHSDTEKTSEESTETMESVENVSVARLYGQLSESMANTVLNHIADKTGLMNHGIRRDATDIIESKRRSGYFDSNHKFSFLNSHKITLKNTKVLCPDCDEYHTGDKILCEDCGQGIPCDYCQDRTDEDELTTVSNGDRVCRYCLENNYSWCERCEEWYPENECTSIEGEGTWCDNCRDEYAFECNHCGDWHSVDGNHYTAEDSYGDTVDLCESCYQDNAFYCDECGESYYKQEPHEHGNRSLCDDCHQEAEEEEAEEEKELVTA